MENNESQTSSQDQVISETQEDASANGVQQFAGSPEEVVKKLAELQKMGFFRPIANDWRKRLSLPSSVGTPKVRKSWFNGKLITKSEMDLLPQAEVFESNNKIGGPRDK